MNSQRDSIAELIALYNDKAIEIYRLPDNDVDGVRGFYRFAIKQRGALKAEVWGYDEYEMINNAGEPYWLHCIFEACEDFAYAEDYLVWCTSLGIDAADMKCRAIYFDIREKCNPLYELLGRETSPIASFDLEMNINDVLGYLARARIVR